MTATTGTTRTCRCGKAITPRPGCEQMWMDEETSSICTDDQYHAPAIPECRTQDTICQWANEDGTLNVSEGDLVLYDGRMEQVDGFAPLPLGLDKASLMVLIAGHWQCVERDGWTAVRRYITEGG